MCSTEGLVVSFASQLAEYSRFLWLLASYLQTVLRVSCFRFESRTFEVCQSGSFTLISAAFVEHFVADRWSSPVVNIASIFTLNKFLCFVRKQCVLVLSWLETNLTWNWTFCSWSSLTNIDCLKHGRCQWVIHCFWLKLQFGRHMFKLLVKLVIVAGKEQFDRSSVILPNSTSVMTNFTRENLLMLLCLRQQYFSRATMARLLTPPLDLVWCGPVIFNTKSCDSVLFRRQRSICRCGSFL